MVLAWNVLMADSDSDPQGVFPPAIELPIVTSPGFQRLFLTGSGKINNHQVFRALLPCPAATLMAINPQCPCWC
jgi:hypothetical protein